MRSYPMVIDGQLVNTPEQDDVINPAHGAPFATCARATKAHVDEAIAAAQRAYPAWRKDEALRRQKLNECAAALQTHAAEIAEVLTQEQGKPLNTAMMELFGASMWFSYFAGLETHPEVLQDDAEKRIQIVRKPLGVVAAITPWNFPVVLLYAASDLKRVTLELGGNDPAIVLDDVDPAAVIDGLFWGAFTNSGQVCTAIKRLYVHEKVYAPIVDGLIERAKAVKVGDGREPDVQLGPINNKMQFEKVVGLVEDATRNGARVVAGGKPLDRPGYFYPPTIVTEAHAGIRLVDEEQFGTALPVIKYRNLDDVMAEANRTHFGLGGSVWTSDLARGEQLVQQIESGTGWVNQHMDITPFAPFGGCKWSGLGYENGKWGYEEFTEMQVVNAKK